ncbi:MAG: hypothetical protein WBA42_18985 [Mesorhizobium sp.]
MTMHKLRPTYYEELGLEADAFEGKRVLEVGCGPLVPIQQFSACERHGIDPLADLYMASGWPLFDYDVRQAFNATRLEKIAERGKAELFAGIVNRFGLTSEGISRRFGTLTNTERFALWHGHKLPDLRPM